MVSNKRRLISVFFILVTALFLTGCEQAEETTVLDGPYVGGSEGLKFSFQEYEPPQTVLDDSQEDFFITLVVKNMGEYTIPEEGIIASLSGIDANAFGLNSLSTVSEIPVTGVANDQGYFIEGGEELLEFDEAEYVNDVAASFDVTLRADVCYEYETEALAHLCLKENVVKKSIEDVCETNNPELGVYNSGAPIQVSGLRQKAVGANRVQIVFTVQNVGGGLVYLPETFTESCKGMDDNIDKLKVTLRNPQDNFEAECSAFGKSDSGELRLVNGRKEITCNIDTTDLQEVSYQDLLIIDLKYMYRDHVRTSLTVQNALT